jgi:hypothetical protein
VRVLRIDSGAVAQRLADAFHVLGERSVPGGRAYALAAPPYRKPRSVETFTVVLRPK